uniref:Uncharacterized protein n=1 Tax=Rhizophora mucronata TaxID=61149 RepID=A0A2P2PIH5_RHIMU
MKQHNGGPKMEEVGLFKKRKTGPNL